MIRRTGAMILTAALMSGCGDDRAPLDRASAETVPTTSSSTTTTAPSTTTTEAPLPTEGAFREAETPVELAARIAAAEAIARDPATSVEQLRTVAFDLQLLYRQLSRIPEWEPAVLETLPSELRDVAWAQATARREFRAMHSKLSETLPAWRIVAPAPAEDLLAFYREGEATFGVPWEILAAVNLVETGMGRIRGTSIAGAQGPMQFIPGTWDAFGEGDINDPHDAILAAARYLAHNGGGSGDLDNALFRYNRSRHYVEGVKLYAGIISDDPQTFFTFYEWQVVYLSYLGDIWLPVGYEQPDRIQVADYLRANPDHLLGTRTN